MPLRTLFRPFSLAWVSSALQVKRDQLVVGDALNEQDKVQAAMEGFDGLVILTSAVPKIKLLSLIGVFWGKLTGKPTMPEFYFEQTPEQVRAYVRMRPSSSRSWTGRCHRPLRL